MSTRPPELPTSEETAWFDAEVEPDEQVATTYAPAKRPMVFFVALASSAASLVALGIIAAIVVSSPNIDARTPAPEAAPAAAAAAIAPEAAEAPRSAEAPAAAAPAEALAEPAGDALSPPTFEPEVIAAPRSAPSSHSSSTHSRTVKKATRTSREASSAPAPSSRSTKPTTAKPAAPPPAPARRFGHFSR